MPPKVLKRCSLCNNFHASYLVEDLRLGKLYLCYSCWTDRQASLLDEQRKLHFHHNSVDTNHPPDPHGEAAGDLDEERQV